MSAHLYRRYRNSGCRITDDLTYKGYRSLLLENEYLLIHLLLDKGGEPVRWLHKPTDTDFIWHTRMGLLPRHELYPDYQMTYMGGWQEMFPEVSYTHEYRGATYVRGESAVTPWDCHIVRDEAEEIIVLLRNRLRSVPVVMEKRIRLRTGDATVHIGERLVNESPRARLEVNWGHHLAYGAPFLNEETRVELDDKAKVHHPAKGETWAWPIAEQDGEKVDLSRMAAPGTQRDLLYVTTDEAKYRLLRPHDGLALEVRWDRRVWPYLWYWQNFRADDDGAFFGSEYNIGLEMFNVPPKWTVAEAAARGAALEIGPGESLEAWLEIEAVWGRA